MARDCDYGHAHDGHDRGRGDCDRDRARGDRGHRGSVGVPRDEPHDRDGRHGRGRQQ